MNLKDLRKEIQKQKNLEVDDLVKEIGISQKSIYRAESNDKFKKSIFIKYLIFLRKNDVDLNHLFDKIFNKNNDKNI